jgi:hypothetical protein
MRLTPTNLIVLVAVLVFGLASSEAVHAAKFGCRAESYNGVAGNSWNYPNLPGARARAMAQCLQVNGRGCHIVTCQVGSGR